MVTENTIPTSLQSKRDIIRTLASIATVQRKCVESKERLSLHEALKDVTDEKEKDLLIQLFFVSVEELSLEFEKLPVEKQLELILDFERAQISLLSCRKEPQTEKGEESNG